MTTSNAKEIKAVVREQYAAKATGAIACCAPDAQQPVILDIKGIYAGTSLTDLPIETVAASAGCGNPTALAALKPGEVVLDLGSGGGIDCFLASRAVGPEGKVFGVDMTPEMIALARTNAEKVGASNVEFRLGEMEALPIEAATVDVVISNCVVCLSPDKAAVFQEAYRVLRPGGRIHLSDMMLVGELPQAIRDDPQRWAECVSGADQQEDYLARLEAAGFRDIMIEAEAAYRTDPGLENLRSVRVRASKPE
ncbi:MAG: arsenite methyltransferase [Chloroflexi bacterium]|nr:arsenite methyltransferase [Chloroflexota bacterium]